MWTILQIGHAVISEFLTQVLASGIKGEMLGNSQLVNKIVIQLCP